MPIYEYRCENGHAFEAFQAMSDEPLSVCRVCDAPVQRVLSPVAVHFKGSGFYTTDYARKGKGGGGDGGDSGDKKASKEKDSGSKGEPGRDSGSGSKSESSAAKAGSEG